jgi:SAM-dependent methyltransferase
MPSFPCQDQYYITTSMPKEQYNTAKENYTCITECRLCKSNKLFTVLDFGHVPLANSYPSAYDEIETFYPLTVVKCDDCDHIQLKETINPEILFTHYSYASSDSPALLKHFKEYAATLTTKLGLGEYDTILEVGSNDGILLKEFVRLGFIQLYGVEPAANMAERSLGIGAVIFNKFFNEVTAKQISITHGKMSVICANNVFAHVADVDGVIKGVTHLLCEDGVFVFENAYLLDTIKGLYFDQVYHEHLQYYGIKPLVKYLTQHGLEIFDIEHVSTQGGSFRIYAKFIKSNKHQIKPSVKAFLDEEETYGLYDFKTYSDFNNNLVTLAEHVKAFIKLAQLEEKKVSCYGCPAKFALFSKVFGLNRQNIEYVIDDSPLKQSKYSPGRKIPINGREHFVEKPTDYCLISVWNMANAVMSRNPEFKGKWIIPMPEFKIV